MKHVLYVRKSSEAEDRQVQSLEGQENELKRLAESQGIEILRIFRESMSAKDQGRPVFAEMMQLIVSGKVQGILCWKPDRLARNFIDGGKVMDMLQRGVIKEIRTPERVYLPTDNVLLIAVEFGMANQYVRDLSTNVKRGNRTKLERGEWPNHAPFGYLNDKVTKTIVLDPVAAPFIKRAFELYAASGRSMQDVSDQLYSEGFRTRQNKKAFKSVIHKMITSPFYYGLMVRDGKSYQGNHAPIITKDLFDRAQDVLNGKLHPRKRKHVFALRGCMTCAICGCMLTATKAKGHTYYYCTNGKKICTERRTYLKAKDAEKLVANLMKKLEVDEKLLSLALRASEEKAEFDIQSQEARKLGLLKALESVQERQDRLLDSYLALSTPKAVYEAKMEALGQERISLQIQVSEIENRSANVQNTFEQVKSVFSISNGVRKAFIKSDDSKKRELAQTVLSNISVGSLKTQDYQFKFPYDMIAELPKPATFSMLLGA